MQHQVMRTSGVVFLEVWVEPARRELGGVVDVVRAHRGHELLQVCLQNKTILKTLPSALSVCTSLPD